MNIPGNNGGVPIVGKEGEPVVLNAQIIITPQLRKKMDQWQNETGVHMVTLGNVLLTLGLAALNRILDNDNTKQELNEEISRIQE